MSIEVQTGTTHFLGRTVIQTRVGGWISATGWVGQIDRGQIRTRNDHVLIGGLFCSEAHNELQLMVFVQLRQEEQFVVEGNEILICEDENNTQYVAVPSEIDYARLPATVLKRLAKVSSRKLCIKKEEIEKYLEGKAEVTFKYNNKVYCVESVEKDTVILSTPTDPSVGGEWDYDFTKPVKEDIEIEWKQNSSDTEAEN